MPFYRKQTGWVSPKYAGIQKQTFYARYIILNPKAAFNIQPII